MTRIGSQSQRMGLTVWMKRTVNAEIKMQENAEEIV